MALTADDRQAMGSARTGSSPVWHPMNHVRAAVHPSTHGSIDRWPALPPMFPEHLRRTARVLRTRVPLPWARAGQSISPDLRRRAGAALGAGLVPAQVHVRTDGLVVVQTSTCVEKFRCEQAAALRRALGGSRISWWSDQHRVVAVPSGPGSGNFALLDPDRYDCESLFVFGLDLRRG